MIFAIFDEELEEVFIIKLFDYKLSSGKCLLTVNWAELVITTVDTLQEEKIAPLSTVNFFKPEIFEDFAS